MLDIVQKTGRDLPGFAYPELMEQVLTERELKVRQSSKGPLKNNHVTGQPLG